MALGRNMRAYLLSLLMVTVCLTGCVSDDAASESDIGNTTEDELVLPEWQIGEQWLYTFITPEFGEDSARLVVADIRADDGLYMLGISSEAEAQRHAVINHNPFLGRVTMDGLSVYENGDPQPVFNFPWEIGNTWEFRLLGQDWSAKPIISTTEKSQFLHPQVKVTLLAMFLVAVRVSSRAFFGLTMKVRITCK